MADPHGRASVRPRRRFMSNIAGDPPIAVWEGVDGKFYSNHSLPELQGPFDTLLHFSTAADRVFRSNPRVVTQDRSSTRPRSIHRHRAHPTPSPAVTEDFQQPPPPLENIVADVAESASALTLQELDASSVAELLNTESFESVTATTQTVPYNTIDGSSSTFQPSCEEPVAVAGESASALTLQEQDVLSSDKFLVSSVEESITASSQTVLHNTIDGSPNTLPVIYEKHLIYDAVSASALTLQEPDVVSSEDWLEVRPLEKSIAATPPTVLHNMTDISPPSASSLGSPIFICDPPDWYQTFYIRMDREGIFHMYPKLNGPFQSLQEAKAAINHHLDELRRASGLKKRHEVSRLDWMIQQCIFYPDGTRKKGPNSPARKNPNDEERRLIQALLEQYNESRNLFQNFAHELKDLVNYQWFFEDQRAYYHFNFTTKTKKADDDNLFFAEVSRLQQSDHWVLSCCCMIKPNDNGHCNACMNNGSSELKHPQNTFHSLVE